MRVETKHAYADVATATPKQRPRLGNKEATKNKSSLTKLRNDAKVCLQNTLALVTVWNGGCHGDKPLEAQKKSEM